MTTEKISEILKESKKEQTTGNLVRFNNQGKPTEYCALGVLGCHKNLISVDYTPDYKEILRIYNIPEDMIRIDFTKELGFKVPQYDRYGKTWYKNLDTSVGSLDELIFSLNDNAFMPFKEIGEFLETNLGL